MSSGKYLSLEEARRIEAVIVCIAVISILLTPVQKRVLAA